VKKNLSILFCIVLLTLSSFSPLGVQSYKVRTIVIDAGHGGKDPGCHGTTGVESKVTLAVALELGRIIKENMPSTLVYYTRMKDNFIELHDRASLANRNNADLFISIHCNSGPSSAYGTETYVMGLHASEDNLDVAKRENEVVLKESNYQKNYDGFDPKSPQAHILFSLYQNAYIENSILMASKIEHQFSARVGRSSRGVKQAGFLVLWKTTMPSVLVELGYLTNAAEEKYLTNKTNQVYLASGIYRAIKEYKGDLEN
jgi:N-acetylmuramoyl-L-alanine amidase